MAFHQILSDKELQIAPVGLYLVAGDDGAPIDDTRSVYDALTDEWLNDVPARLMARVRVDGKEKPAGVEGIIARADGLEIIKAWVPVSLIEAADKSDVAPEAEPITPATADAPNVESVACPNCGAPLTNAVIQSLTVCPNCGKTVALMVRSASIATSTQTVTLSADTIKALKQLRPKR